MKWAANVGGTIRIDWAYVDMPIFPGYVVRVFCKRKTQHNVEDPHRMISIIDSKEDKEHIFHFDQIFDDLDVLEKPLDKEELADFLISNQHGSQ